MKGGGRGGPGVDESQWGGKGGWGHGGRPRCSPVGGLRPGRLCTAVDFRPGRCRRESTLLARGLRRLFPRAWQTNAAGLEALRYRPTCVTDPASVAGGRRRARVPPRPEPRVCLGRRHGRHRVSTPYTDPPSPCRAHEMTQRPPDPIQLTVPATTGSLGRVSSASLVHHSCVQESKSAQEEVRDRGSEVLFQMLLRHQDGARRSLPAQEDIA